MSLGVSRYTTWYGNRATGARRTGRSRGTSGTGVPARGHCAMKLSAASTPARNSEPSPVRWRSYQTAASSSSAEASSSERNGLLTVPSGGVQHGHERRPKAPRVTRQRERGARASRSPSPRRLGRQRDRPGSVRRDWRAVRRPRRRARQPAMPKLRGEALALAASWAHSNISASQPNKRLHPSAAAWRRG